MNTSHQLQMKKFLYVINLSNDCLVNKFKSKNSMSSHKNIKKLNVKINWMENRRDFVFRAFIIILINYLIKYCFFLENLHFLKFSENIHLIQKVLKISKILIVMGKYLLYLTYTFSEIDLFNLIFYEFIEYSKV